MAFGTVSNGGVVSTTLTLKLPCPVFPAASVAEQFTVVVPSANVLPEAGEQPTGTDPLTASEADAVKDTTAPEGPVASTVTSLGNDKDGAVVSTTLTLKLPCPVFP